MQLFEKARLENPTLVKEIVGWLNQFWCTKANDILRVTASDCGSGSISKASFPLDARWRASQIAMDQMIQRAETHWEQKMVIEVDNEN